MPPVRVRMRPEALEARLASAWAQAASERHIENAIRDVAARLTADLKRKLPVHTGRLR